MEVKQEMAEVKGSIQKEDPSVGERSINDTHAELKGNTPTSPTIPPQAS